MELDFSDNDIEEQLGNYLRSDERPELELEKENIVEDLYSAMRALLIHINWIPNARIVNRKEEKKRFLEKRRNGERYEPDFEFKDPEWETSQALTLLTRLEKETERIDEETLEKFGAEYLTVSEFQKLLRDSFREFRLWVNMVNSIEDRETWRELCLKIWPMVSDETIERAKKRLENMDNVEEQEKNVAAEEVAERMEEEIERLDFDWDVEVKDVPGCHNVPEQQKVVVARGSDGERLYSKEEKEMVAIHEIFHAVRAYNGMKVGEKSGLPPFLGVHTPFYDMTEEGGALYREKILEVMYPAKEQDYNLRILAAKYMSENMEFTEIVEKLISLGSTPERAFILAARNREVLRHHIYMGGFIETWENEDDVEYLLLGKVDPEYAKLLEREMREGSMLERPPVGPEKLFSRD
ncbi:MAG: tyrosine/phenylalanine carboxypeptidase domain-containing protein [Candidatus Nanohaloarchaea archaeon]